MGPKPLHSVQHGQLCILSVDDDQVNLLVIEQLLQPSGIKVISASDGEEALAALGEEDTWPDLVLLDYTLHGETGEEVCKSMREVFGDVQVPIVMCTALTAGHDALASCMQAGATDYLLKPYDKEKMMEKIKRFCGPQGLPGSKGASPATPAPASASATTTAASASAPAASVAPAAPTASSSQAAGLTLEALCKSIDLEYCGKKLEAAGFTIESLRSIDDAGLRKAGIVVKAQRDKILEAVRGL